MAYESYRAVADQAQARELAATESPFTIEVRFLGGLNARQKAAFTAAADRWVTAIVGDLPPVRIGDEVIDDVLIEAQGRPIDGPGKILGQAGPTHIRPEGSGASALLPAKGVMTFDTDDLKKMQSDGTLNDVITHEMGHVLGIGTVWPLKKLLKGEGTDNPTFSGKAAIQDLAGSGPRGPGSGGEHRRAGHRRRALARDGLPQRADVRFHRRPRKPDECRHGRQSPGPRVHRRRLGRGALHAPGPAVAGRGGPARYAPWSVRRWRRTDEPARGAAPGEPGLSADG